LYYSHGPEFNTWYSARARAKKRFVTVEMYTPATDESDLSSSNEFAELAPLRQPPPTSERHAANMAASCLL